MAERDETKPLVTDEELDLELLVTADRILRAPVRNEQTGRAEYRRFPISSQLSIPSTIRLYKIETALNDALRVDDDDEAADASLSALERAQREIHKLILERTPDAPEPELDVQQALVLISWLSGSTTVADLIAKTLTAGYASSKTEEQLAAERAERNDAEPDDAEGGAPLHSTEPSPTLSSGSGGDADGDRAGGSSLEELATVSHGESFALSSSTSTDD